VRYPPVGQPSSALAQEHHDTGVGYTVVELNVRFEKSRIADFSARVQLELRRLFDRDFRLEPVGAEGVPSPIELVGSYQDHDGQPIFEFTLEQPRHLTVEDRNERRRALTDVSIERGTFTTRSRTPDGERFHVLARFALQGALSFSATAFSSQTAGPLDVFGFGDGGSPLPVSGMNVEVSFFVPVDGGTASDLDVTFSPALGFGQLPAARPGSLPSELPLTLSRFVSDAKGIGDTTLGGQACHTPQYADLRASSPRYAFDFTLPLGTLGALSSVHAALEAHLVVGWGPMATEDEEDGFSVTVVLPQLIPGFRGMNLQGVLKTAFGSANLLRFREPHDVLVLLFNNVQLKLLGFGLPPGVVIDMLVFADGNAPTPGLTNVAWLLAAHPPATAALLPEAT
jgi:hypothetical protein